MREIIFKKAILNNFRGQSREVVFKTGLTQIVGFNGTGKTSIFAAAKWCFCGVDELNRSNYDLFDNKLEFTHENAIPAVVEFVVEMSGVDYQFKRQAKQKWIRPRGSAEYVKDKSDEYKFFVDELEVSATAYKDKVAELFGMDVEKLKLCMDAMYYQMLDWKELRKHFADIVGQVKDSDLDGDYSAILPYLEKYKGEKAKEYLNQQIKPLKSQIDSIESDIRATERMMPDMEPVAQAEQSIAEKEARIAEINKEILGIEAAHKPFVEKRSLELAQLAALKSEFDSKALKYTLAYDKAVGDIENELAEARTFNANIDKMVRYHEDAVAKHKANIQICQEGIESLDEEIARLRAINKEMKQRTFNDTVCPHCGQELPVDQITALRIKFDEENDKQREPIVARGLMLAEKVRKQREYLLSLENEKIESVEVPERKDIASIEERLNRLKSEAVPFADTDEARDLTQKIESGRAALTVVPEVDSAALREELNTLVADIKLLSEITARRQSREQAEKAIADYQKTMREVGIELAKWEGLLDLLMAREREWADVVRTRANKNLRYSHVEMVELNKSGERIDTCTLSINGVDRGVTNHANKTIIGIDISNAICKRYDVKMPLFIDDFEHFTDDMTFADGRQVITMSADKHYPELTIL